MNELLIHVPAFTDSRTAARYPVIVPPAPIDVRRLPWNAAIRTGMDGSCRIEIDAPTPDGYLDRRP